MTRQSLVTILSRSSHNPGVAVAMAAALACLVAACDPPGQVPPAPGTGCDYGGKSYRPGDTFRSTDGCNTCSCAPGGAVRCTLVACVDGGGPTGGCLYEGKTYPVGATFPSADGCNQCNCLPNGSVGCTKRACPKPDPAPCRRTGCSGQVCASEDVVTTCEFRPEYACYQKAICERLAGGACGFRKTRELESCLADLGR